MSTDYGVISADSHVVEPHDLWQQRVEDEFKDRAPRLVRDETTDRLVCDQAELPPVGLLAGCARGDDEVRLEGRWEDDVFRGGYDPHARIADLERDGVVAEVLYPTIGMQLYPIKDVDFQWSLFRAYNSWLAEDFCAAYPDRFKGVAMINHEDLDTALIEVKRAHDLGLAGFMVPLYAGEANPYHDPQYDPLWAAAIDYGMPVSLHAATTRDRSKAWNKGTITDGILKIVEAERVLCDMIMFGLFDRFPELKVISAESDAGWAGNLLERADFLWHRSTKLSEKRASTLCRREPHEYWRENVRVTFMRDHTAIAAREIIGVESLMWGNDFPHHVSTWPNSQKVLHEHFDNVPADVRKAVVHDNVRALYAF